MAEDVPLALTKVLPQVGRLVAIGLSPARRAPPVTVERVRCLAGNGLEGDHHARGRRESKRQVTLIQAEHLPAIASMAGVAPFAHTVTRRNLLVAGINLLALKDRRFRIGDVLFEGTGPCDPCSRMEEALGPGGMNAMRGHGGITAKILEDGDIAVGDLVVLE